MQQTPDSQINHLALAQPPALQSHDSLSQHNTGLSVDQSLSADPGYFDLFLSIEAAVFLFAQQQAADQAPLASQRDTPYRSLVFSWRQRDDHGIG